MSNRMIDLLLEGVTDKEVLLEAWNRQEAEKRKALEAIASGDFEEIPEEELD